MLSLGKMAAGQERYYTETVAQGREDYYLGKGEAPGRWLGRGPDELALQGEVSAEALGRLLNGSDPISGAQLGQLQAQDRVAGWDATFSAPKSVSLLWALGSPDVSSHVRHAHEHAVEKALAYLEEEAARGRRGAGGQYQVKTRGFIAAGFRHRTSRALDPQLHTHVLIANLVQGRDGRWGALDGRLLYAHARTAGFLYEAELRQRLTQSLGVEFGPVRNGIAELAQVPRSVLRTFSRRRLEIERRLEERGEESARAAQVAALDTRGRKPEAVDWPTLSGEWQERAEREGFGATVIEALLGWVAWERLTPERAEGMLELLSGPEGLTKQISSFSRRDVLRAIAQELGQGGSVELIESLADGLLASERVVPLQGPASHRSGDVIAVRGQGGDGKLKAVPTDLERWSTPEMLATEASLLLGASARCRASVGLASREAVESAIARRPILQNSSEQRAMVEQLASSGAGVEVVRGKAGSGKTTALQGLNEAWKNSGLQVYGLALAGRTAQRLQAETGVSSMTIEQLWVQMGRGWQLPSGSVLVVDEAAMVGTRRLTWLAEKAESVDAKLVLVGDDKQLAEIDAGGGFRGLAERLGAMTLTENRRQAQSWEREALEAIREGEPGEALAAYQERGAVVIEETGDQLRELMVADWLKAREAGEEVRMIARRRQEVAELNRRARAALKERGQVLGPELDLDGASFGVGDEVITRQNDRRLGVLNGTSGKVVAIDWGRGQLTIRIEGGREVELPTGYLQGQREDGIPYVMHAYATTAHLAQGATYDRALVLAGGEITREWGYVALSRGRQGNRLYAVNERLFEISGEQTHVPEPPANVMGVLAGGLEKTEGKHLAADHMSSGEDRRSPELSRHERQLAWLRQHASRSHSSAGRYHCDPERHHEREWEREL